MEFKQLSEDSLPTMQTEINNHLNQGWKCENRPMIQQIMISKSKTNYCDNCDSLVENQDTYVGCDCGNITTENPKWIYTYQYYVELIRYNNNDIAEIY